MPIGALVVSGFDGTAHCNDSNRFVLGMDCQMRPCMPHCAGEVTERKELSRHDGVAVFPEPLSDQARIPEKQRPTSHAHEVQEELPSPVES